MFQEFPALRLPRHSTLGPRPSAGSLARRLVRRLALLDSWAPLTPDTSAPQTARSHLRPEWARSADLTERQSAALLALDETTPWSV